MILRNKVLMVFIGNPPFPISSECDCCDFWIVDAKLLYSVCGSQSYETGQVCHDMV